ncbi:MAG: YggS family pyridoxal phosphate-dependent enzyme [Elusimicrobiota bacterium]
MLELETSREKIAKNLYKVETTLKTLNLSQKPEIMAVIKYACDQDVLNAAASGIKIMGENRLQDAQSRWENPQFKELRKQVDLHFIGRLQSNKAAKVASFFDSVDSIDCEKSASILNSAAEKAGKKLPVMIQLKINSRQSQGGAEPSTFPDLFKAVKSMKNLSLRGLMAIGPITEDESQIRKAFLEAKKIYESYFAGSLNEDGIKNFLSMGMSSDYIIAAEEGSSLLRIGSILFERQPGEK